MKETEAHVMPRAWLHQQRLNLGCIDLKAWELKDSSLLAKSVAGSSTPIYYGPASTRRRWSSTLSGSELHTCLNHHRKKLIVPAS